MKSKFPVWVYASIALTAIFSILAVIPRIQAEESNKAVGLAVEFTTVKEVAALNESPTVALEKLKNSGINSVVLSEQSGSDLINEGLIQIRSIDPTRIEVTGRESAVWRLAEAIDAARPDAFDSTYLGGTSLTLKMDSVVLRGISVGIDPDEIALAKTNDLFIIARYANRGNQAKWLLDQANSQGVQFFLPLGDSVMGFKDKLDELIIQLQSNQIHYVSPEFSNMVGDTQVKSKSPLNVVRLHTAQTAELSRMEQPAIVERYAKAFRERNNRILLIRPQFSGGSTQDLAKLVAAIKSGVIADGGAIKVPRPFDPIQVNIIHAILIGLTFIPILFWSLREFLPNANQKLLAIPAIISFLLVIPESTRKYAALLASIIFAVVAYQWLRQNKDTNPFLQFVVISTISLVGGLQVPALLLGNSYMLQAGQFTGVKASVFAPIFIVAILLVNDIKPIKSFAKEPILWGTAALSLAGIAALLFMNSRTGNDNPAGVSGSELALRNLLDRFLPVRPRTKEFLIGNPALVLGLGFLAHSKKQDKHSVLTTVFLAISVIGQTSIVNTMCHLHTPYLLSLLRILSGLIAGGMLGLVLWVILRPLVNRLNGAEFTIGGNS